MPVQYVHCILFLLPLCVFSMVQHLGTNDIQVSCRQCPTLGFGSESFILRVIFSLSLSHTVPFPKHNCFVIGTDANFQLGCRSGERRGVGGLDKRGSPKIPSEDIRSNYSPIRSLSDRLKVRPIWMFGTIGVGGLGVLRSLQPPAPPSPGTPPRFQHGSHH